MRWGWQGGSRKVGVSMDHLRQKEREGDEGGKQMWARPMRTKADAICKGL